MTINQVAGQYPTTTAIYSPSGIYSDFWFATFEEVQELYSNFGINLIHGESANTIAAYTAFDYLGTTTTLINSQYDFYLQRGTVIMGEGLINSMGIQTDFQGITAHAIVDYSVRNFDFDDEDAGVFLVRNAGVVPIPSAVWLFGSGLICLVGFARRNKV